MSIDPVQDKEKIFVPGVANVYFSEDMAEMIETSIESGSVQTKSLEMNSLMSELGIIEMERIFPHAGEYELRTRREGLHRWYRVVYSDTIPQTKAQASMEMVQGIDIIEPVMKPQIQDFNDMSSDLWGLYNPVYEGFDVNVKKVWENFTTGDPKVIVSVVDGGVDLEHEDLRANCLVTGHYNGVDGGYTINPHSHGTHVAGTIAAVSNNGKGIAGIAGGNSAKGIKGVSIMSSQILKEDANGSSFGGEDRAIKMAADNGAVISQNSWGYHADFNGDGTVTPEELEAYKTITMSAALSDAIDYFIKYAGCDNYGRQRADSPMKGGVVFFASGNEGIDYDIIGASNKVISVGAIDKNGSRASFSNYGDWVDLCAPGVDILSTVPGGYSKMQGTSMACPHVSGVAALIVSHFGGPGFTNEMLLEKILGGANTTIVSPFYKIGGLVDAYGAFMYGDDKAPSAATDLKASGRGNGIDLEWVVPADEDGVPAYGFLVIYGKDRAEVEAASHDNLDKVGCDICVPDLPAGEKASHTVTKLDFESQYYIKVLAYSYGRNYADPTEIVAAETTENHAPVITTDLENNTCVLLPSATVNVRVNISDPDGHEVTYTFDAGSDAASIMKNPDGTYRMTINGSAADMGTYTAVIVAEDEYGLSTRCEIVYTIKENSAPVKIKDIEDIMLTAKGKEFVLDMTQYASDPDNEQLKYDITVSNPTIVHLNARGDKVTGTALGYGVADVTLAAKDAKGEKVEFLFKVQVKDPSKPLSVYPNPVTDYVNVGTLDMAETTIRIFSSTGKLMHDQTSQVSAMEPARIDMTACPPGVYSLEVVFGGKEYRQNVVKL